MSTPGGGHLANYSGGFIGQGARLRGGKLRFKPGEWKPVDGPGSKVALWTELMFSVPGGADEGKAADTKGGPVGRRPAGQSQAKKAWKEFDKLAGTFTFIRGELTSVAGDIAREVGYKGNTVEKLIRPKYRELEETQKHTST